MGALKLSENSTFHEQSKHVYMRHHYIWDALRRKRLRVPDSRRCIDKRFDESPSHLLHRGARAVSHAWEFTIFVSSSLGGGGGGGLVPVIQSMMIVLVIIIILIKIKQSFAGV